jgi:hypothetical protein
MIANNNDGWRHLPEGVSKLIKEKKFVLAADLKNA